MIFLFKILSADGSQEVGLITRQYEGLRQTLFNFEAQHTFGISRKPCNHSYIIIMS